MQTHPQTIVIVRQRKRHTATIVTVWTGGIPIVSITDDHPWFGDLQGAVSYARQLQQTITLPPKPNDPGK